MYNNLVSGNDVAGNGLSGLTLHAHVGAGSGSQRQRHHRQRLRDEQHEGRGAERPANDRSLHRQRGPPDITVFLNVIHDDYYGVYTASPNGVTVNGLALNAYVHDTVPWYASNSYSGSSANALPQSGARCGRCKEIWPPPS